MLLTVIAVMIIISCRWPRAGGENSNSTDNHVLPVNYGNSDDLDSFSIVFNSQSFDDVAV